MREGKRAQAADVRGTWATPAVVFAVGAAFLAATWWHFELREKEDRQRRLGLLAEQVAARLESVVASRVSLVHGLRRRWEDGGGGDEARWHVVGEQLRADFSGFQALNWMDGEGRIRWVDPLEGNEAAVGADLTEHPVVGSLFRGGPWPAEGRVSPPVSLLQGGQGVVLYVPLGDPSRPRAWVSGVFRVDDLVRACLPEGAPPGHVLRLLDLGTGGELLHLGEGSGPAVWQARARSTLQVGDRRWALDIAPIPGQGGFFGNPADEFFAFGGLLLLAAAAWLLHRLLERGRQLSESRSRYRSLVESAPEAIVVLDVATGHFVDANSRAEELLGRSRAELSRLGPGDISPPTAPDGRPAAEVARELVARAVDGEEPVFEWFHLDAAGRALPCEIRLRRLGDESPLRVRGTMIDIRARKEAEKVLRESEEKYRRIVDTAHEGVWLIDEQARTTFVNRRMAEILGGGVEEILGMSMFDFMEDEDREQAEANFEKRRAGVDEVHDFRFRRLDGSHVWTLLSTNSVTDDEGRFVGALAMVADVTTQRQLEEQLRQSQKLEAVGRLAGGIAHDFNNIITGVLGAADLLAREVAGNASATELVDEIHAAGERAGGLTRQLLAFSRRQVSRPEVVDLCALAQGAERMLARLIGERHELRLDCPETPVRVLADPAQLEQVLLNLVVNARDAQSEGGRISVRVASSGSWARLEVEDGGPGVPEPIRDRVFEPFFTTKDDSGTGLGLSTVHGIVTGAGGRISIHDPPGGGALFRVELPLHSARDLPAPERPPSVPAGTGGLRILLVDDEDAVRRVVRQTLLDAGHEVREAERSEEALELLEACGSEFDLLLTDLRMPGLGGLELAARAAVAHPRLRLVVMTGFSEDGVSVEGRPDAVVLTKPFRAAELLRAVASATAGSRSVR